MSELHGQKSKEPKDKDALRITDQYRSKGGITYDLKCAGVRLAVHVSEATNSAEPGGWKVEARCSRSSEDVVVVAQWGATRLDALRAVGQSWGTEDHTHDLRVFEWDAVAKILDSVKALG